MIRSFNFTHSITKNNESKCKKIIDYLFESDNWCKQVPTFQTWPNLHCYTEFDCLVDTFIQSCSLYLNKKVNQKEINLWCYMDYLENYLKKDPEKLWHQHGNIRENKLSGIYYLVNPEKLTTEFKDYIIEESNPFTWYIFPSHYLHRPPKVISSEKRYTLAADLSF
jgi:hypothetical protein